MSYEEYNDLLLKCQNTGEYRVFTFDISNSKAMEYEELMLAKYYGCILMERLYQDLLLMEKSIGKKILINDDGFPSMVDDYTIENEMQIPNDWFLFLGDAFGITIHNKSINPEIVYKLFNKNYKELNINFSFHSNDIVYETNKYAEGRTKYFRGYAIFMCSELHKKKNDRVRRKLNKVIVKEPLSEEEVNYYMDIYDKNHALALENGKEHFESINKTFEYIKK